MARRQYSNIAVDTTLVSGINDSVTSMIVANATGWPSAPFVAVLEPGTSDEELVLVGSKSGTTFSSLTRGYGGTSAVAHNGSDVVKHVIVAEDLSLIWTHLHTAGGGDDTAQLSHDDLSSVSADDHHAKSHTHDGVDGSGTLAANSVDTTQIADGAVTTAKIPDNAITTAKIADNAITTVKIPDEGITAAKIADGVLHEEVSESVEENNFTPGSTYDTAASVSLFIPATWNSWECYAYATFGLDTVAGTSDSVKVRIRIAGVNSQELTGLGADTTFGRVGGSVGAHRTGITTTGGTTVLLEATENSGNAYLADIFFYARAVRTS